MKIGYWKTIMTAGTVIGAMGASADEKGKVDTNKLISNITTIVIPSLGLTLDPKKAEILNIAMDLVAKYGDYSKDKVVTTQEALRAVSMICKLKNIPYDEVGFETIINNQ